MLQRHIRLNPALDPQAYAADYARDGVVQVRDLLDLDSIAWLIEDLNTRTPWSLSLLTPEGGRFLSPEIIAQEGREAVGKRVRDVIDKARDGFGFIYLAYGIIPALLGGRDAGHATHALVEFFNSPEFLDFGRAVTHEPGVTKIDAQATWFRPGDFLNVHDDKGEGERRAAYTLGLSMDWRADWGGQLLFHDDAGDIIRGFRPGFNVWTVFRTPQVHSVAQVASYAGQKRLSITGWLRDDPPVVAQAGR